MAAIAMTEAKYHAMSGRLDETAFRIWAATKAHTLGCGGKVGNGVAVAHHFVSCHDILQDLAGRIVENGIRAGKAIHLW